MSRLYQPSCFAHLQMSCISQSPFICYSVPLCFVVSNCDVWHVFGRERVELSLGGGRWGIQGRTWRSHPLRGCPHLRLALALGGGREAGCECALALTVTGWRRGPDSTSLVSPMGAKVAVPCRVGAGWICRHPRRNKPNVYLKCSLPQLYPLF